MSDVSMGPSCHIPTGKPTVGRGHGAGRVSGLQSGTAGSLLFNTGPPVPRLVGIALEVVTTDERRDRAARGPVRGARVIPSIHTDVEECRNNVQKLM